MFELEQIRLGLGGYDEKLEEMSGSLDVAGARDKIAELEELSADPDFWSDLEKSQKTLQQLKALKNKVGKFENLETTYEDILTLIEMGIEEQDESVYEEVKQMNDTFLSFQLSLPLRLYLHFLVVHIFGTPIAFLHNNNTVYNRTQFDCIVLPTQT